MMATYHPSQIAKALIALLLSLATWGGTALAPDSDGFSSVEPAEWFGLCGVLAAFLAVFAYPNKPAEGEAPDPRLSEQHVVADDRGQVSLEAVLLIAILVLVLVFHL